MTTTELRTDLSLSIDRVIKAPAEKLFQAWLDPEMLKKFMLPGPNMSLPSAKVDAREGGRFDLIMRDWFKAIYEVLLGASQGPRFGSFIALYGIENTIALIDKGLAGDLG
jgi:lysyl-tRNA synthetase class 1